MALPIILVREFDGPNTSHRIPARRARNYWEFLEHVHLALKRPWERYNSHLHFEDHVCDGQVNCSEWNAGAYFDAEFIVDGRLILYAHFEEVEVKMMEGDGNPSDYEVQGEEVDRAWNWGSYYEKALLPKRDSKDEDIHYGFSDEDFDPYPPFPIAYPSRTSDFVPPTRPTSILLPDAVQPETITIDDSNSSRHLQNGIVVGRAMAHCCRDPHVRPTVRAILNKEDYVVTYIPSKYAERQPTKGDIPISANDIEYLEEFKKVPVGEKRTAAIKIRLQARLAAEGGWEDGMHPPRDVDMHYAEPRLMPSLLTGYSNTAATNMTVQANLVPRDGEEDGVLVPVDPDDTKPGLSPPLVVGASNACQEAETLIQECGKKDSLQNGVIIGTPKNHLCRYPDLPPGVRAFIKAGRVRTYVSASGIKEATQVGDIRIDMRDIDFSVEFAGMSRMVRSATIRKRIQEVAGREGSEGEGTTEN